MVEGEPTGGDQAMQVRMVAQVLAPGMEYGEDPDACPEMAWISGDLQQGFGGGTKQQVVEQRWLRSASGANCSGRVKTTCEYATGNRLVACRLSQRSRAVD